MAVIGSGPAGLTWCRGSSSDGYKVKISEALHESGGVIKLWYSEFRLPKKEVVAKR